MKLQVKKLHNDAIIPTRATEGAVGFDLYALDIVIPSLVGNPVNENFSHHTIAPNQRLFVRTGISVSFEKGTFGLIHARSGMALKHGITVVNAPGLIDTDYHGDIGVILLNTSNEQLRLNKGDRIAQIVFNPHDVELEEVAEFTEAESMTAKKATKRGSKGFGSTGVEKEVE